MTTKELAKQINAGRKYLDISSRSKLNDIVYFVSCLLKADGDINGYERVAALQDRLMSARYYPIKEILEEHIWD